MAKVRVIELARLRKSEKLQPVGMVRCARNFFADMYVDGRRTKVATGPRSKDGGLMINLYQRDRGSAIKVGTLYGVVLEDGRLELSLEVGSEDVVRVVSDR